MGHVFIWLHAKLKVTVIPPLYPQPCFAVTVSFNCSTSSWRNVAHSAAWETPTCHRVTGCELLRAQQTGLAAEKAVHDRLLSAHPLSLFAGDALRQTLHAEQSHIRRIYCHYFIAFNPRAITVDARCIHRVKEREVLLTQRYCVTNTSSPCFCIREHSLSQPLSSCSWQRRFSLTPEPHLHPT